MLGVLIRRGAFTALLVCALVQVSWADAEDSELGFGLIPVVQHGKDRPAITFSPAVTLRGVVVKCALPNGRKKTLRGGTMRAGQRKVLRIKQGKGVMSYRCEVTGKARGKRFGPHTFTFELKVGSAPRIAIRAQDVDFAKRKVAVRVTEPKGKLILKVFDEQGEIIDEVEQPYNLRPGTPIAVSWKQRPEQVTGRFELRAYDAVGFWSGIESVTFVNIPHEDVVFDSGKWDLPAKEVKKLKAPLERVVKELRKVAGVLPMTLYVAGYTDTVGKPADNVELSRKRARSIAAWFKKRGLKIPIRYQGFGESALFVKTPDNTPEAKNRRAVYVLSVLPPPRSAAFPRSQWTSL